MDFNIRFATAEDCPRILELINELAVYERAPEEVTVSLDHFIDAGFGENPVWKAYLNSLNDKGAGFKSDTNKITIFNKALERTVFEMKSKTDVAKDICAAILKIAK